MPHADGTTTGYTWAEVEKEFRQEIRELQWFGNRLPTAAELAAKDAGWSHGFESIEYLCSMTLDLVGRGLSVLSDDPEACATLVQLRGHVQHVRGVMALFRAMDSEYWVRQLAGGARGPEEATTSRAFATASPTTGHRPHWTRPRRSSTPCLAAYFKCNDVFRAPQDADLEPLPDRFDARAALQAAFGVEAADLAATMRTRVKRNELLLARRLASVVRILHRLLVAHPNASEVAGERARDLVAALVLPDEPAVGDRPTVLTRHEVLRRMLSLYVVHSMAEQQLDAVEGVIDFVQISADIDSPLDPGRNGVADKIAGVQLGHFGAFFKSSWRANDWMWGRLDGLPADRRTP